MNRSLSFFIIISGIIITSCTESQDETGIIQVRYGTSFGECIGYCLREMKLEKELITYNRSGWNDTIFPITCTDIHGNQDWHSFLTSLDTDSFFELSETIGCPDCADGGAEWLEIEMTGGEKHRVTFEYQNEPSLLADYVSELRSMMESFESCEGQ